MKKVNSINKILLRDIKKTGVILNDKTTFTWVLLDGKNSIQVSIQTEIDIYSYWFKTIKSMRLFLIDNYIEILMEMNKKPTYENKISQNEIDFCMVQKTTIICECDFQDVSFLLEKITGVNPELYNGNTDTIFHQDINETDYKCFVENDDLEKTTKEILSGDVDYYNLSNLILWLIHYKYLKFGDYIIDCGW